MTPTEIESAFAHPAAWLARQFECEFCEECGGDAEHHACVPDVLGLPHATCLYSPAEDGSFHPVILTMRAGR